MVALADADAEVDVLVGAAVEVILNDEQRALLLRSLLC